MVRNNIPEDSLVIGNPARVVCSVSEYIEKNREKMKKVPVYETHWRDKTEEEKNQMIRELEDSIGFDI